MNRAPLPFYPDLSLDEFVERGITQPFVYSWDDSHTRLPIRFGAALTPRLILFGAECNRPPDTHPRDAHGAFVEGLWEFDVCEMFVLEHQTSSYQEFNLGPRGAWWTALFSDFRKRVPRLPRLPTVEIRSEVSEQSWRAAMSVERDSLSIALGNTSRIGISGILGSKQRHFLCSYRSSSPRPEFHRSADFSFTID